MLGRASRDAAPRHRTLEATIHWSYGLLSAAEQRLLRWLSVFVSGFDLDAAESVAAEAGVGDVLEALERLVAKSLVEADTGHTDARYRMMETLRQYALERLRDAGELAPARRVHAQVMLRLAERAAERLTGPAQQAVLARLDVDLDNLRAPFAWAEEADDVEVGLRLAAALGHYWYVRGGYAEGLGWLRRFLAAGDAPVGVAGDQGATGLRLPRCSHERSGRGATRSRRVHLAAPRRRRPGGGRPRPAPAGAVAGLHGSGGRVAGDARGAVPRSPSGGPLVSCRLAARDGMDHDVPRTAPGRGSRIRGERRPCSHGRRRTRRRALARRARLRRGAPAGRRGGPGAVRGGGRRPPARRAVDVDGAEPGRGGGAERRRPQVGARSARRGGSPRERGTAEAAASGRVGSARTVGAGRGRLAVARTRLQEALDAGVPLLASWWLPDLARTALALGDADRARVLAEQGRRTARATEHWPDEARALSVLAVIAVSGGHAAEALAHVAAAVEAAARTQDRWCLLVVLETAAEVFAACGREKEAVRLLARRPTRCGNAPGSAARRLWKRPSSRGAACSLPASPRASTFAAPSKGSCCPSSRPPPRSSQETAAREGAGDWTGGLTRSEREVARLAGEGLTTPEIADRLFVSPRTVQTHLAHIYQKLGVSSRRDLIRLAGSRT